MSEEEEEGEEEYRRVIRLPYVHCVSKYNRKCERRRARITVMVSASDSRALYSLIHLIEEQLNTSSTNCKSQATCTASASDTCDTSWSVSQEREKRKKKEKAHFKDHELPRAAWASDSAWSITPVNLITPCEAPGEGCGCTWRGNISLLHIRREREKKLKSIVSSDL